MDDWEGREIRRVWLFETSGDQRHATGSLTTPDSLEGHEHLLHVGFS